jgi:hypothetical protein
MFPRLRAVAIVSKLLFARRFPRLDGPRGGSRAQRPPSKSRIEARDDHVGGRFCCTQAASASAAGMESGG